MGSDPPGGNRGPAADGVARQLDQTGCLVLLLIEETCRPTRASINAPADRWPSTGNPARSRAGRHSSIMSAQWSLTDISIDIFIRGCTTGCSACQSRDILQGEDDNSLTDSKRKKYLYFLIFDGPQSTHRFYTIDRSIPINVMNSPDLNGHQQT